MLQELSHESDEKSRARLFDLLMQYAFVERDVVLASGQKSSFYLDCRQVYFRGEAQYIIGELFFKKMAEMELLRKSFDACGGMAMGSIPLSCALTAAAFRRGRELPGFAVRKEAKDHGMEVLIEGNACLHQGASVLIVEDVVTTATSAIKAVEALRAHGVVVDTLFAIVDRNQGGLENLSNIGVKLHSLFSRKDFVRD